MSNNYRRGTYHFSGILIIESVSGYIMVELSFWRVLKVGAGQRSYNTIYQEPGVLDINCIVNSSYSIICML